MGAWLGQVRLARSFNPTVRKLGQDYSYDDSGYGEQINAQCYTCADPQGVEAPQYGIDAGTAANLQNQGWDCRRDECAAPGYTVWGLTGRIPLTKGLGRRALQG